MTENIEYKAMTIDEIDNVLLLWENTKGIFLHSNGEDSFDGISFYLNRNPGLSFIASINNKIIGAILCGHDGRRGFIHHLAVDSQFQSMGIGSKLVNLSVEKLKEIGIKKLALFVLKDNVNAQDFYRHIDFNREEIVFIYSKGHF